MVLFIAEERCLAQIALVRGGNMQPGVSHAQATSGTAGLGIPAMAPGLCPLVHRSTPLQSGGAMEACDGQTVQWELDDILSFKQCCP